MSVTSTSRTFNSAPGAGAIQAPSQGTVTVALVEVAGQPLGLLGSSVEQVKPASPVRGLPGAPMLIEGVIEVQGEVVPVLDGRRRLAISHRDVKVTDHFVILRVRGQRLAMHVDAGAGVIEVPAAEVAAASAQRQPTFGCTGIARLKGGLFLVHDADALLTPREFAILDAALATVRTRTLNAPG